MTGASVGTFLIVPNLASLAAVVASSVAIECQTRLLEDPYLRQRQAEYDDYAARIGRFLPRIGRLRC